MTCALPTPAARPDRRATASQDAALADLMDYAARVAAWTAAQCGWRASAAVDREDLAQVARLEAWRRWLVWDASRGASLITYAHPYVAGAVVDHLRAMTGARRVVWPRLASLDAAVHDPEALAADPEALACQAQALAAVRLALAELPARERREVEAYYWGPPRRGRRSERHKRALICLCTVLRERGYDLGALL